MTRLNPEICKQLSERHKLPDDAEPALDTVPAPTITRAEVEQIVEKAVTAERERAEAIIRLLAECNDNAVAEIANARKAIKADMREHKADLADEVRALRLELTQLQTTLCELRATLATERMQALGIAVPSRPSAKAN